MMKEVGINLQLLVLPGNDKTGSDQNRCYEEIATFAAGYSFRAIAGGVPGIALRLADFVPATPTGRNQISLAFMLILIRQTL
jgi:hypothetical protein